MWRRNLPHGRCSMLSTVACVWICTSQLRYVPRCDHKAKASSLICPPTQTCASQRKSELTFWISALCAALLPVATEDVGPVKRHSAAEHVPRLGPHLGLRK
jgi:hypothetical protein